MLLRVYVTVFIFVVLSGCAALIRHLEPPQVTLRQLDIGKITLQEQHYHVGLRLKNPNPISLPINRLEIKLFVNDVELLSAITEQEVNLPAQGEKDVSLDVASHLLKMMEQIRLFEKGKGKLLQYRVIGNVSIKGISNGLEFSQRGEYPLP